MGLLKEVLHKHLNERDVDGICNSVNYTYLCEEVRSEISTPFGTMLFNKIA